jgi:glutathione S-transferase
MMQLYWAPRTRSFTALWLLEEAGQPYEKVLLDIMKGAHKKPDYLGINPMGKVPALRDGDVTVAENAAIAAYVADRYPDAKLAPPTADPDRGRYLQWLFFGPSCVEPAMIQSFLKFEAESRMLGWGSPTQPFDALDAALDTGPWLLGARFSAADVVIGSTLNFAVRQFKVVPARPNFDRYIDACAARPAYKRAEQISAG